MHMKDTRILAKPYAQPFSMVKKAEQCNLHWESDLDKTKQYYVFSVMTHRSKWYYHPGGNHPKWHLTNGTIYHVTPWFMYDW